jgi:hypothetical protein
MIDASKVTQSEAMQGMIMLFPPTRERWAYPDLFSKLGLAGKLKSYYLWYALKVLDTEDKGQVSRCDLIDYCQQAGWEERTVKTYLAKGNGVLWEQAKRGRAGGQVCYLTASQVFRALDGGYRLFEARLMAGDCVAGGYDTWLRRQLESFVSHSQGKPFSRDKIEKWTKVKKATQRRVGLVGERNCLIRPVVDGDDLSDKSLADNRYLRWANDELMQFLASSYGTLPVVPSELEAEAYPPLDFYPSSRFYFWTEDEAKQCEYRYDRYVIQGNDFETIPAGKGHSAEAVIWYPGKDSAHWQPLEPLPENDDD